MQEEGWSRECHTGCETHTRSRPIIIKRNCPCVHVTLNARLYLLLAFLFWTDYRTAWSISADQRSLILSNCPEILLSPYPNEILAFDIFGLFVRSFAVWFTAGVLHTSRNARICPKLSTKAKCMTDVSCFVFFTVFFLFPRYFVFIMVFLCVLSYVIRFYWNSNSFHSLLFIHCMCNRLIAELYDWSQNCLCLQVEEEKNFSMPVYFFYWYVSCFMPR